MYTDDVIETQFLIGKSLMVAPIVQFGAVTRKVYFPSDQESWYMFKINSTTGNVNITSIEQNKGKTMK